MANDTSAAPTAAETKKIEAEVAKDPHGLVWITHPGTEGVTAVQRRSLRAHAKRGWKETAAPAGAPKVPTTAAPWAP